MAAPAKEEITHVEETRPPPATAAAAEEAYAYDVGKALRENVVDTEAAGYTNMGLVITDADNKRLRWLANKRVLPWMCLAYLMQAMDKGTLGLASIMGWQEDVGAVGQDYALTSTFLWIGIIIGEPLANQFCRRFPVAKTLGYSMIAWSALVMGLAFSLNTPSVFVIRVLLGIFESTFGPCLLSITIQWYLKEEQPWIQAIWFSMFGVANAISSLIAFAFYYVTDTAAGLRGWQWMTVTISLISFVSSGLVIWYLPDSPTQVKWASEADKVMLIERVRRNDQGIKNKVFKKEQMWEAVTDPFVWLLTALLVEQTLVVGGLNTFNKLLINEAFGFDVLTSQLLGIPLAVDTVLLYFLAAYLVTRFKQTIFVIVGFTVVNIIGTIVLITVPPTDSTRPGLIVAFYLMQCFQATNPSLFSLLSRNNAGATKKSVSYAMVFIGWAVGNAIASQLFINAWAPRYLNSLYIHLGLYVAFIATALTMRILLTRRNKKKESAQDVNENAHAFEDLTDLKNPDFRYSV